MRETEPAKVAACRPRLTCCRTMTLWSFTHEDDMENDPTRRGMLYGVVAYAWWGLVPLYFRWVLGEVP